MPQGVGEVGIAIPEAYLWGLRILEAARIAIV